MTITSDGLLDEFERRASLEAQEAEACFLKHPAWHVMRDNVPLWYFETSTRLRYPYGKTPADEYERWQQKLSSQSFWLLDSDYELKEGKVVKANTRNPIILETATGLLWHWFDAEKKKNAQDASTQLAGMRYMGLVGWQLPAKEVLMVFRDRSGNPAMSGYNDRLYDNVYWLSDRGCVHFGKQKPSFNPNWCGDVFACQPLSPEVWSLLRKESVRVVNSQVVENPFHRIANKSAKFELNELWGIPDFADHTDTAWLSLSFNQLRDEIAREKLTMVAADNTEIRIQPGEILQISLTNLDYQPCRLPKIELVQLTDPNKGLWELWGEDANRLARNGLRARNPKLDVHREWVAIDFGTSSTVVAVSLSNGGKNLLRVGVRDFNALVEASHYENPTVLEFIDLQAFLDVWNQQVYRPRLNWDQVRAAHEARADFQSNAKDPKMVSSVLLHLKSWALEAERSVARIVDQTRRSEYLLEPLREDWPVRGQAMAPHSESPLDVIELYAWYLGMVINWRQHGIYLNYAMTFPVKYPQDLRNRIMASFARGLQRSLPASLISQTGVINDFQVKEVASEPMAYAAAMLVEYGLEPTTQGLAYAVFDFGGGTTDFDYGLWRLPTPEETDEEGAESVFERLGAGGDPYLGGENLLAALAYQVFRHNLATVAAQKLLFMRPVSEADFPGSEALVDNSALARANSAMLAQELRPLLESPEQWVDERLTLDFSNRTEETISVDLELGVEELKGLIRQRVERGMASFLSEMHAAFHQEAPESIHILLAGNASRGIWVREAFSEGEAWTNAIATLWCGNAPDFIIHHAEGADQVAPGQPNCKTAVALGALDLVPGREYLQKDRLRGENAGDAPFQYFVGPIVQKKLQPVLKPGPRMQEWQELGIVRQNIFRLGWSDSPRARGGLAPGDGELKVRDIAFPRADKGFRCFARVMDANRIELVAAESTAMQEHRVGTPVVLSLSETGGGRD